MRSLALGEGLVDLGWRVVLATSRAPRAVIDAAQASAIQVRAITAAPGTPDDAEELASLGPNVAVIDGYHNSRGFFDHLTRLGCLHAVIDDNVETQAVEPDIVINQNPHAAAEMYAAFPRAELLLGLKFALLRRSVREHASVEEAEERPERPKALISMGGSDPLGLTLPLVREIGPLDCDVRVAVGPANVRAEEIRSEIEVHGAATEVEPDDYISELADCSCAVIGAGSTLWEAAFLGVPTIGVIVADNQAASARSAQSLGFTCTIEGRAPDAVAVVGRALAGLLGDPQRRAEMSFAGRRNVDGRGVQRVAAALAGVVAEKQR